MGTLPGASVEDRLAELRVETPSWGYGDSGTRFAVFPQPDSAHDVFARVDAAAEVRRLTGSADAVALHFPWDETADLGRLRAYIESSGLRVGAVNANLFQDPAYRLGSLASPFPLVRDKAVDQVLECAQIAAELGSTAQSLWLGDGTNYAGQDDLRDRRRRLVDSLERVYAALPEEQELLIEYKPFEPSFYATDIADWGSAILLCAGLGARARVLVDIGHHMLGTNVAQIVALLSLEGRLGGIHMNARHYADDDLLVGSVDPFELFLIFVELVLADPPLPRLTIDQSHNIEPKREAMVLSVMNLQEAYAKALLVDLGDLRAAQLEGDVLGAHELLRGAFATDVRDLCAAVRARLGAALDPVAAVRRSRTLDAE